MSADLPSSAGSRGATSGPVWRRIGQTRSVSSATPISWGPTGLGADASARPRSCLWRSRATGLVAPRGTPLRRLHGRGAVAASPSGEPHLQIGRWRRDHVRGTVSMHSAAFGAARSPRGRPGRGRARGDELTPGPDFSRSESNRQVSGAVSPSRRRRPGDACQRSGSKLLDPLGRMGARLDRAHRGGTACGSIPRSLHVVHRLISIAAVSPPLSLPANNQFFRPIATGLKRPSQAPLSSSRNPASKGRFSAAQ